jgi:uncharacterized Zn finger protein (UPF0148 family)
MYGLFETGDMDATAPRDPNGERYEGYPVNKDGRLFCPVCGNLVSECTCKEDKRLDIHTSDLPDEKQPALMGNVPQETPEDKLRRTKNSKTKKENTEEETDEGTMDYFGELDTLLLEEYLGNPDTKQDTAVSTSSKTVSKFTEQFYDYMERNGDNIDRKPSDVPVKPLNNTMKHYYDGHFNVKNIR